MILRPTTWGDIWPHAYVQDGAGETWKIVEEKAGWMLLQNRAGQRVSQLRPPDSTPVVSVEMTEPEALAAIYRAFPGAEIIEIKEMPTP